MVLIVPVVPKMLAETMAALCVRHDHTHLIRVCDSYVILGLE